MAHATEPLSAETSARLVDLARACKGAARVVAMYPATHPAIQDALARMTAAGTAAVAGGPFQVSVTPETLLVGAGLAARRRRDRARRLSCAQRRRAAVNGR